jgi:hypothetical protein
VALLFFIHIVDDLTYGNGSRTDYNW